MRLLSVTPQDAEARHTAPRANATSEQSSAFGSSARNILCRVSQCERRIGIYLNMAPDWSVPQEILHPMAHKDQHERLPGYYLPWELPEILQIGGEYRIEPGAETSDGSTLVAVFRRIANHDDCSRE